MMNTQLELGFVSAGQPFVVVRRQKRQSRANWWFERMRQVVDRAFDWQPTPPPRPEQIWLETGSR
jgi:hypothetical protein